MQLLISLGVEKFPDSMVLKRWTKKARLPLSGHFALYDKQDPTLRAQSYRHSSLMISVLEYVDMADKNVEAYKVGLQFLEDGKNAMRMVCTASDGMGLADRGNEIDDVVQPAAGDFNLRVPISRRERGRPTNKRAKAPYEGGSKRPRFCSICHSGTHNKSKCPNRAQQDGTARKPPVCSGCGVSGHTVATCGVSTRQLVAIQEFLV